MKKTILLLCVLCAGFVSIQAQVAYKDIESLTFLGVDYSVAKVYGADETPYDFRNAFLAINNLFISESGKYNVHKYLNKRDISMKLSIVTDRIEKMNPEELKVFNNNYKLTDEEISEYVKNLEIGHAEDYVAVFVADLLDKSKKRASYHFVVFNTETREIVKHKQMYTKAKGFGLRNYWASSMRDALKGAAK